MDRRHIADEQAESLLAAFVQDGATQLQTRMLPHPLSQWNECPSFLCVDWERAKAAELRNAAKAVRRGDREAHLARAEGAWPAELSAGSVRLLMWNLCFQEGHLFSADDGLCGRGMRMAATRIGAAGGHRSHVRPSFGFSWVECPGVERGVPPEGNWSYSTRLLTSLSSVGVPLRVRFAAGLLERDYVAATLLTPWQQPLHVCTTHLESADVANVRGAQLGQLLEHWDPLVDSVALGDLNWFSNEPTCTYAAAGCVPKDVWQELCGESAGHTFNPHRNPLCKARCGGRIDRILAHWHSLELSLIKMVRTCSVALEHPKIFPSDHFGLVLG